MNPVGRVQWLLLLTLAGCQAEIIGPVTTATGGGGSGPTAASEAAFTFACNPTVSPSASSMARLSQTEYVNTLTDLVSGALPSADATAVMSAVSGDFSNIPPDLDTSVRFTRMERDVTQTHVDAFYDIGVHVGSLMTAPASRLTALAGSCATDADTSNDVACMTSFIQTFGKKVLRRPLTSDEVTFYLESSVDQTPAGYTDLITLLLNAPHFLYHFENNGQTAGADANLLALSAYELAARLSYQFWETTPDAALTAAADDGSLLTDAVFTAQLNRVLSDPRTRTTLDEFFGQWLHLDQAPDITSREGTAVYDAFAGADEPTASTLPNILTETLDLTRYYTWSTPGSLTDLLTTTSSFAKTDDVAHLYGVAKWSGTGAPVAFTDPNRVGVLSHAAMLLNDSHQTRPVLRGVFVRREILCEPPAPPPPGATSNLPTLSPLMTTRQTIETLTQQPGTTCNGCHGIVINPIGFAYEEFDALGRARTVQPIFDDTTGNVLARLPIDSATTPAIWAGDKRPSTGAVDASQYIAQSNATPACFARQYFRFSYSRAEDLSADACTLEQLRQTSVNGSLKDVFKTVATQVEYKQRRL